MRLNTRCIVTVAVNNLRDAQPEDLTQKNKRSGHFRVSKQWNLFKWRSHVLTLVQRLTYPLQISLVFFFLPCISIQSRNENQTDALFTLSLFRQSTSTCFGHIYSPSSGDILYIHSNWYVMCFSVDCLLVSPQIVKWKAQHVPNIVYSIYSIPPDDRLQICPETCRGWLTK